MPYDYDEAKALLGDIINGFESLSGDTMGPSGKTWQDIATQTARDLRKLANRLDEAITGNVINGPVVFPSPNDLENGQ